MDLQALIDEIADGVVRDRGDVAGHIPGLDAVDPDSFGISVAMSSGEVFSAGDAREPFSIQSVSKVFSLALVLAADADAVWSRVGREPSGTPYNSLMQLEVERGIPRNPFINAGALVVTDHLLQVTGDAQPALLALLRRESANPDVDSDEAIAAAEAASGHRNAALAHFLASHGNLVNPVDDVLAAYFWQCALRMTCEDLARAGLFLARAGRGTDGTQVLDPRQVKRINAIMLTCGTYDAAGEFAYRVGVPGKSGVGGGILAVIPGRCTIGVWGPRLGPSGNSVAGVAALDEFTRRTNWSVF